MKKILLSAAVLMALTACNSPTPTPAPAEQGSISLKFYKTATQELEGQDLASDKTSNIRIRISNPATGFNVVKDVAVADAGLVSVSVPAKDGYVVEARSYYRSGSAGAFLKQGAQSGISVQPNNSTSVNLVLQRPNLQVSLPDKVVGGSPFQITLSNIPEFFSSCYAEPVNEIRTTPGNITKPLNGTNNTTTLNAPDYGPSGMMYIYSYCVNFLNSTWITSDSTVSSLYYFSPDSTLGEAPASTILVAPAGGINIGIGY